MRVRPLRQSDIPALNAMVANSEFPYPDLNTDLESVQVVVDDEDAPIMAVAAERIVQLYLYSGGITPARKLAAVRMLHAVTATELKKKGYNSCEAFLPPSIAAQFGRRLERTFGWVKNWQSWTRRL